MVASSGICSTEASNRRWRSASSLSAAAVVTSAVAVSASMRRFGHSVKP